MARNGESFCHHKGLFVLSLAGLLLSTGGILLKEPLLTISKNCHDKISIFLPAYAYLFFLNPLCFYLNMLLLLLQVSAPEAPTPVFLMSHLPRAVHTVSFATLFLSAPLSFHVAIAEEQFGSAIGAALVFLALVIILTFVFKKFLISIFRTGRDLVPALFALCISTGYFISFDPLLSFSEQNHYDPLTHHIPINLVLLFISFIIFMVGIILVILWISAPDNGGHASIFAENLVIDALSVSFAVLLVGGFIKFYGVVTDMAAVVGG